MSILDINKGIKKTILSYILLTIFLIIFDRIYAMFSHGVSSFYMNYMFLYTLIGGCVYYLIIGFVLKNSNYENFRFTFNIYNSGIAIVTVGSLLHGILKIAGTSSSYIIYYNIIGWIAILIGFISTLIKIRHHYSFRE